MTKWLMLLIIPAVGCAISIVAGSIDGLIWSGIGLIVGAVIFLATMK